MIHLRVLAASLILFTAFGHGASAHDYAAGDLEIIHPSVPQPSVSATTAAGYFSVTNHGAVDDRLIGVETLAAAAGSLHLSQVDDQGVASMVALDGLDIPAGGTVTLEPGALHLMLTGLTAPLTDGQMVPATLIFAHAGRVAVVFLVTPPGGGHGAKDHTAKVP